MTLGILKKIKKNVTFCPNFCKINLSYFFKQTQCRLV